MSSQSDLGYYLYQNITEKALEQIKDEFARETSLNEETLLKILRDKAKLQMTPEQFSSIFKQINLTCTKLVNWDEFITYLILQYKQSKVGFEKETLLEPISSLPKVLPSKHRHPVNKVVLFPCVNLNRTVDFTNASLISSSKDGCVNFWSLNLQHQRQAFSTNPEVRVKQTWVLDTVVLPDFYVLCTSSTERDLRFYETSAKKFLLRIVITSLPAAVTTMSYNFNSSSLPSKLLLGDFNGRIKIIFIETKDRGPFRSTPSNELLSVRFEQLVQNVVLGFQVVELQNGHCDFVRQILYDNSLNCIISCAQCKENAVILSNLSQNTCSTIEFNIKSGVWCLELEENSHKMATGSPDCLIRIWNLFVPNKATSTLFGHHSPVVHLTFQDAGKYLYSLSQDKWVKVWDVSGEICVQSFNGLTMIFGKEILVKVLYLEQKRQWVIGGQVLAVLELNSLPNPEYTDGTTHSQGISVMLYNKLFNIIITCGLDSYIITWNPWDGRRMLEIKHAHTKVLLSHTIAIEITAACFGPNEFKLLTGAQDGTLKIWDFNSGDCLQNFSIFSSEIRAIFTVTNRILVCGWNRSIVELVLDKTFNWTKKHESDISCGALRAPEALATASYSGELIFWKLETGQAYKKHSVVQPEVSVLKKLQNFDKTMELFPQVSVTCMLFLENRVLKEENGTLFVALSSGIVQVWSHHVMSGFLTSFNAIHHDFDQITCMQSDGKNEFLFTGTLMGYIKTWLIKDYCLEEDSKICMAKYRLKFPFLWKTKILPKSLRIVKNQLKPILLNCFKAHLSSLSGLLYFDASELLFSTSSDASIRSWTLSGRFVQTLGTFKTYKPVSSQKPVEESFNFQIPVDLKRVLSRTSLRVLMGGKVEEPKALIKDVKEEESTLVKVDKKKFYGKSLTEPVLGEFYKKNELSRSASLGVVELSTSLPLIPVYQHLVMPEINDIVTTKLQVKKQ